MVSRERRQMGERSDYLLDAFDFDGFHLETSDQGRCTCARCGRKLADVGRDSGTLLREVIGASAGASGGRWRKSPGSTDRNGMGDCRIGFSRLNYQTSDN